MSEAGSFWLSQMELLCLMPKTSWVSGTKYQSSFTVKNSHEEEAAAPKLALLSETLKWCWNQLPLHASHLAWSSTLPLQLLPPLPLTVIVQHALLSHSPLKM